MAYCILDKFSRNLSVEMFPNSSEINQQSLPFFSKYMLFSRTAADIALVRNSHDDADWMWREVYFCSAYPPFFPSYQPTASHFHLVTDLRSSPLSQT